MAIPSLGTVWPAREMRAMKFARELSARTRVEVSLPAQLQAKLQIPYQVETKWLLLGLLCLPQALVVV